MQEGGYECYAPDMPGHGKTYKPTPSAFKYDAAAYGGRVHQLMTASMVHVTNVTTPVGGVWSKAQIDDSRYGPRDQSDTRE
jgi:esterase/lipase